MAESVAIDIVKGEGESEVIVSGVIDERAGPLFDSVRDGISGTLRLNLANVSRINSYGVGVLMRFLSRVSAQHEVRFEYCSERLVDQFQMLEFSIFGRITSFYMLYYCERCQREERALIDVSRDVRLASGVPYLEEKPCSCGGRLVPEDSIEFVREHL